MRQRLMRLGETLEHFQILTSAEPVAQPFGFVGPHPAEPRPQRFDQLDLIAVSTTRWRNTCSSSALACDQSSGMARRALR